MTSRRRRRRRRRRRVCSGLLPAATGGRGREPSRSLFSAQWDVRGKRGGKKKNKDQEGLRSCAVCCCSVGRREGLGQRRLRRDISARAGSHSEWMRCEKRMETATKRRGQACSGDHGQHWTVGELAYRFTDPRHHRQGLVQRAGQGQGQGQGQPGPPHRSNGLGGLAESKKKKKRHAIREVGSGVCTDDCSK